VLLLLNILLPRAASTDHAEALHIRIALFQQPRYTRISQKLPDDLCQISLFPPMNPFRQSELCIDESSITEEDLVANVRCISAQFLHLKYLSHVRPLLVRPHTHTLITPLPFSNWAFSRSVIMMTNSGYIKRLPIEEFEAQSRGGKVGCTATVSCAFKRRATL
jgi:DNA gyrase C-terminal domain, beta-propeller